jgi:hypothetical protein
MIILLCAVALKGNTDSREDRTLAKVSTLWLGSSIGFFLLAQINHSPDRNKFLLKYLLDMPYLKYQPVQ